MSEFFQKRLIFQKNNQPTKNKEGACCIYTLVLHFVPNKQSCKSSNKKEILVKYFLSPEIIRIPSKNKNNENR